MPLYFVVKDLQYFNGPAWQAKALTLKAGPFEADGDAQAQERALDALAQANPVLAILPGRVQLYRLDPLGGPLTVGADIDAGRPAESEENHA